MRIADLVRRKRVAIPLQLAALAVLLVSLGYAVRDVWPDAAPRLRNADPVDLVVACVVLAAYYLVFVLGWMRILAAFGIHVPYRVALQSEMFSMLAKYVPGGVWTPAARVVALRRFGTFATPVVLASVLLEAGLSAIAGVLVFVASLPLVASVDAPLLPLILFAMLVAALVHPTVFRPVARFLLRPFGAAEVPALRWRTMLGIVAFYAATWPLGGVALFFLIRAVGGDPDVAAIPFLGGRGDRRRPRRLRAVGARSPGGVDVRADPRGRVRVGRAGRDDPQPARDHARRDPAAARRTGGDRASTPAAG
jgi:hypothetical protein